MYFTINLPAYLNESSWGLSFRLLQDDRLSSAAAGEKREICNYTFK